MRRPGSFRKTAGRSLDDSVHAARSLADRHGSLPAYDHLLLQVRSRSALLRPSDRHGDGRNLLNAGLLALSLHHADWLRPAESWCPPQGSARPIFSSLACHLLALHPVPAFMASVWLDPAPGEALPQHGWYKHLGLGRNIRTAGLPLRLTRAMAHLFCQAPDHFSAVAALRSAQVRGLGGSEALAGAVLATRLGGTLENEDFWEEVLHFLVRNPSLGIAWVGPVVDFLQEQKFGWREGVSPEGVFGNQPPPLPDFSLKGRTAASIRALVEQRRRLGEYGLGRCRVWPHSPFEDFRLVEGSEGRGDMRAWTITELLTGLALSLEGQAMRHCVATYTGRCVRRQSSIWSMQVEDRRGRRRVLTVEVDPRTGTVCQARREGNRPPEAAEAGVVRRWASERGLKVAESAGL